MTGVEKPRRLCSEIQLFDLCEKTKCDKKDGRFCADDHLVAKFEAISQEEDFPPDIYDEGEGEPGGEEAGEYPGFGEEFGTEADEEEDDYDDEA